MSRLSNNLYVSFPFRMTPQGVKLSHHAQHIREQIEQVLLTDIRERVFRPEFGAGIQQLLFEPNISSLGELVKSRLSAALVDILKGEVDASTLTVSVENEADTIIVTVSYCLATVNQLQSHKIIVSGG